MDNMLNMRPALASRHMHNLCAAVLKEMDEAAWNRLEDCAGVEQLSQLQSIPGWRLLGAGHFSAVFECGDYAIKLGFKKEDSGAAYAAYCRDNAGAPHLPIIYHIEQIDRFYCVCMPKYRHSDFIPWSRDDQQRNTSMYLRDFLYNQCDQFTSSTFPELRETLTGIRSFFTGIADFDLHRHNFMYSPEQGIVITDPVSFKRGPAAVKPRPVADSRPGFNGIVAGDFYKLEARVKAAAMPAGERLKRAFRMPGRDDFKRLFFPAPLSVPLAKFNHTPKEGAVCKPIINGSPAHLQCVAQKPTGKPSKLLKRLVGNAALNDLTGLEQRVIAHRSDSKQLNPMASVDRRNILNPFFDLKQLFPTPAAGPCENAIQHALDKQMRYAAKMKPLLYTLNKRRNQEQPNIQEIPK